MSADPGPKSLLERRLPTLLRQFFALRRETDYAGTIQQVRSDAEFGSGNIWALGFAILIASIGLNVNSTAVIIGAMLISPLMGPITGAGFALATNDFPLMRRSLRNLLLAAIVGLVASTLYFAISPLDGVQSELLARTRPTLYDVLIALFGGSASMVAVSRRSNKGNVIPGVAIATALMPPLCTAGFGLAHGNVWFFLGALHLFLINALFICLATLGFTRAMGFDRIGDIDPAHHVRARAAIVLIAVGIGAPSVYTGWRVIQEAHFQHAARRFIVENLGFTDRAVVSVELAYSGRGSTIGATLLGTPLPDEAVRALEQRLPSYGLTGTRLVLRQPVSAQASPEQISQMVRQGILDDLYKKNEQALVAREERIRVLEDEVVRLRSSEFPVRALTQELVALYPALVSVGIGKEASVAETSPEAPAAVVAIASWRKLPSVGEQRRLRAFLARRIGVESLRLVNVPARASQPGGAPTASRRDD